MQKKNYNYITAIEKIKAIKFVGFKFILIFFIITLMQKPPQKLENFKVLSECRINLTWSERSPLRLVKNCPSYEV